MALREPTDSETAAGYVAGVLDDHVDVNNVRSAEVKTVLRALGRRWLPLVGRRWRIKYETDRELADALARLRDAGVLFAGGSSGWPPAEVYRKLVDDGLLDGNVEFVERFYWGSPPRVVVREGSQALE